MLKLFFLIFLLSGCRLGPNYAPPVVTSPEDWKTEQSADSSVSGNICNYWEVFHDETLNALEMEAIENNPNLYVALERVYEARALAGIERSRIFPQVTLNPAYSTTGTLFKLYGLSQVPALANFGLKPIIRVHEMQYFLPLNLNYEIDLFGKLQSGYESAFLNAQSKEAAYYTALLTLTSDLAANYFNLRSLDLQIILLENTIEARKKSLEFNSSRYKSGLSNYIDVSSAMLELSNTEAEYEDSLRQRQLFENAIATLIGKPASIFCLPPNPLQEPPPVIPAGIPSEILFQRPDIAEAERTMASQNAQIGVAYASFFPSLSLTGTLGFFSPDFRDFLSWKSRFWSFGANAAQVIFDAGRNCSNLEVTWSRFFQSSGTYQQTVLTAFQEVEDALNNLEQQARQSNYLFEATQAAQKTLSLAENRFKNGLVTYLEVVDSERSELQTQRNFANLLGQRYISTIQLIKALGGSFGVSFAEDIEEICHSSEPPPEKECRTCESENRDNSHRPSIS